VLVQLNAQAKILGRVNSCRGKRVSVHGRPSSLVKLSLGSAWVRQNVMTKTKASVSSCGERVSVHGFQRRVSAKHQLVTVLDKQNVLERLEESVTECGNKKESAVGSLLLRMK